MVVNSNISSTSGPLNLFGLWSNSKSNSNSNSKAGSPKKGPSLNSSSISINQKTKGSPANKENMAKTLAMSPKLSSRVTDERNRLVMKQDRIMSDLANRLNSGDPAVVKALSSLYPASPLAQRPQLNNNSNNNNNNNTNTIPKKDIYQLLHYMDDTHKQIADDNNDSNNQNEDVVSRYNHKDVCAATYDCSLCGVSFVDTGLKLDEVFDISTGVCYQCVY